MRRSVRDVVILKPRPTISYLKVATFGDSTASAKSAAAGSGYADQSVMDRQLNGTTQTMTLATSKWRLAEKYPAAQLEIDAGIGGQNTSQMIARSGLAASASRRAIEDVAALAPQLIRFNGGSINDISGFTTATVQATIDAVFTRHMQLVASLAATGVYILDEGIYGFDGSGGSPAAPDLAFIRAVIIELNQRYSNAIAIMGNPRVRFLSPMGIVSDSTGAYLSLCSTDGTHLNSYGQGLMRDAEAAMIEKWLGRSAATAFPGTNLIATQADYPSPVSGGFGLVPSGTYFSWSVLSGTRQNAVIEYREGIKYAICELNPSGAGSTLTFTALLLPLLFTPAYVSPGDIVSVECDFIAEGLGAPLGTNGIQARLLLGISGSDRIVYDLIASSFPASPAETLIKGRFSWGKVKIPTDSASFTTGFTTLTVTISGNLGNVARLAVGNVRIVKQ